MMSNNLLGFFWFSPNMQSLEVITLVPHHKKKWNKLKTDDFSWTPPRIEVAGQTVTLKPGGRQAQRVKVKTCPSEPEATGAMKGDI